MYHAHRHSGSAWAGEPETDRDIDDEETEGREMTPFECLDLAYRDVLQEEHVQAGEHLVSAPSHRGCIAYACRFQVQVQPVLSP